MKKETCKKCSGRGWYEEFNIEDALKEICYEAPKSICECTDTIMYKRAVN